MMDDPFQDKCAAISERINELMKQLGLEGNNPREIVSGVAAAVAVYGMITGPEELSDEEKTERMTQMMQIYCKQYELIHRYGEGKPSDEYDYNQSIMIITSQ